MDIEIDNNICLGECFKEVILFNKALCYVQNSDVDDDLKKYLLDVLLTKIDWVADIFSFAIDNAS